MLKMSWQTTSYEIVRLFSKTFHFIRENILNRFPDVNILHGGSAQCSGVFSAPKLPPNNEINLFWTTAQRNSDQLGATIVKHQLNGANYLLMKTKLHLFGRNISRILPLCCGALLYYSIKAVRSGTFFLNFFSRISTRFAVISL